MIPIKTYELKSNAILRINSEKNDIWMDPPYQREGGIWSLEKKQLLIDSILNDYDIPKIYFHVSPNGKIISEIGHYNFAVIDGRQRIETIFDFIEGKFPLAEEFTFLKDDSVKVGGLTYPEMSQKHPHLKAIFDGFGLPIIIVETDDQDLIEDLFSRLNEAVPLNAAEKRNAFGGPAARLINEISEHDFFTKKVKFSNNRYQHKEVAARIIFLERCIRGGRILDTKKPYLDFFVKSYKENESLEYDLGAIKREVEKILNKMVLVFSDLDNLLRSQAYIPIYYILFKQALLYSQEVLLSRNMFIDFQEKIKENREIAREDFSRAEFDFLQFDNLSKQGTNDASSIKERVRIISDFFGVNLLEQLYK